MVLYPTMLQELRGYPDSIIGLLLAVRGIGALIGNFAQQYIKNVTQRESDMLYEKLAIQ